MSATIQQIRERFPNPKSFSNEALNNPDNYCVGGALCRVGIGSGEGFPSNLAIVYALKKLGCKLTSDKAYMAALQITVSNDRGDFETAWKAAERALDPTNKESLTVAIPQDAPQTSPVSGQGTTQTNATQGNLERKKWRKL